MQPMKYIASIAALALTLSVGALAKSSNSASFVLTDPAQIGSTTLAPGHYKAEWTGSNNALQITILEHGKTVATVHGHVKELPEKSPYTAVTTKKLSNNQRRVDEIDFSNRTEALVIANS